MLLTIVAFVTDENSMPNRVDETLIALERKMARGDVGRNVALALGALKRGALSTRVFICYVCLFILG